MEIDKIDIINDNIHCYNKEQSQNINSKIDSSMNEFLNTFSDTQDLITINISKPIKRIVKFYDINESIPASFIEKLYSDMTSSEKLILDDFINKIIIKLKS